MSTKNSTIEPKKAKGFTYGFQTPQSADHVFKTLLDVRSWWTGIYDETIKGDSIKLNDEFTIQAGNGAHYTKQKLVEAVPNQRIVWLVTESNLNFAKEPDEWTNTKICFDISNQSVKRRLLLRMKDWFRNSNVTMAAPAHGHNIWKIWEAFKQIKLLTNL